MRRWRGAVRRVQRPWISGVLVALLAWSVASLPGDESGYSEIGSWIRGVMGAGRVVPIRSVPVILFVREGDGFRVHDADERSWDEATRLLRDRPGDVVLGTVRMDVRLRGRYAPTREEGPALVLSRADGSPLTGAEGERDRRAVMKAAGEWLGAPGREWAGPIVEVLRSGRLERVRVLRWGHAHDGAALAGLAGLVVSLGWVPRIPGLVHAWRLRRAAAKGRCAACGYSLTGLTGRACPECGAERGASEGASGEAGG